MTVSWSFKKLGDLLSVQNGFAFDSKAFGTAGMPLIRIRDLKAGVSTDTRYGAEFDPRYIVNAGDFLIGMDGEFGCYEWKGEPALLNQRVCRLLGFGETLEPRFLFYGINAHLKAIEDFTGYTTVKHLSSKQILAVEMLVPPRNEQRRIVAILDEAFGAIATARANAEKNRQNARALYAGQLEIVFGKRDEGCIERRLSDVAREFGRGKSRHRPRNEPALYGGAHPFIQTGDISNADHWLNDFSQTYSDTGLAQSHLWPAGTVCIAIVGATVGETAILSFDACFPDSVIGIVVDSHLGDAEYVEYMLQSFKALLKEKGQGTARDNINLGTFENQLFPFPPLFRQKEIASTLNVLRDNIRRLEATVVQKIAALDELKKSLLHQVFTGALTTKSTDKQLEAAA